MDRRILILSGAAALGAASLAKSEPIQLPPARPRAAPPPPTPPNATPTYPTAGPTATPPPGVTRGSATGVAPAPGKAEPYSQDEIVNSVSDFLGVTAEAAGGAVERIFVNNGRPTAYIAGEEGSGAIGVGARYGRGMLYMKGREPMEVYWQGPSVGWDFGGNASRVFTLCYDLDDARDIFQRFPGVEGSAYFIGGLGVNYQRANDIVLAPIRAGVGFRLGANVGYLAYTKKRHPFPF
ncbi:DUF1134 domain-containing protein [Phenylobacterium sp.]|uniref:DUF1134 domain-containing protein n=1 Tax=Phenylobacterium sp. TaxID=1871053 RepID=UPI00286C466A|nr:DUF1134 domain-containing protein [Phenylobacterium sp.]